VQGSSDTLQACGAVESPPPTTMWTATCPGVAPRTPVLTLGGPHSPSSSSLSISKFLFGKVVHLFDQPSVRSGISPFQVPNVPKEKIEVRLAR
jgi:hypothetical protein